MNPLKQIAIVLITGTGGLFIPLVPQDLVFEYAYQYPVEAYQEFISPTLFASSSSDVVREAIPNPQPRFDDENKDGLISVSVFEDKNGNRVYQQIEEKKYSDMGKKDGALSNPKKSELISIMEMYAPQEVEGAVAITASSTQADTASAISKTLPITISAGSDRVLMVYIWAGDDIYSVAYNSASSTQVTYYRNDGGAYDFGLYYLQNPDTGTNNLVTTYRASTYGAVTSVVVTGAKQTGNPINTFGTDGFVNDNTDRGTSITTTVDGCGVFTAALVDNGGFTGGDANSTAVTSGYGTAVAQQVGIARSATFPQTTAGAILVTVDGAAGSYGRSISWAIEPASGGAVVSATSSTPVVINGGSIRIQGGTFRNTQK
jgi:hypothetical protein